MHPATLLLLCACAGTPPAPPLTAPSLQQEITYFTGSPLAGGRSNQQAPGLPDAVAVRCRFFWSEGPAPDGLVPAAQLSASIMSTRTDQPVRVVSELVPGLRLASGGPGQTVAEGLIRDALPQSEGRQQVLLLHDLRAVALPGITATFRMGHPEARIAADRQSVQPRADIHVSLEGTERTPRVVLAVTDLVAVEAPETAEPAPSPTPPWVYVDEDEVPLPAGSKNVLVSRNDLLTFRDPLSPGSPLVLWIPLPFATEAVLAAILEILPAGESPDLEQLFQVAIEALGTDKGITGEASLSGDERNRRQALTTALSVLQSPASRRQALVFLAHETGATLTSDLALVAPEALLEPLLAAIAERLEPADPLPATEALAWTLEAESYRLLADRADDTDAPPFLIGLLLRHAGEAARMPATMTDLVQQATSLARFQQLLVEENRIALEQSIPASRVRGYDWLLARNLAPPGFDPMASARARRLALQQAEAAQTPAGDR